MNDLNKSIKLAAEKIKQSSAILISTGAGMGVDSGLPDFRGDEGFWEAYPPFAKLGLSFVDMANPQWFDKNPSLAWGFYGHRLNLYRNTVPHKGFKILKNWGESKKGGYFIFTSNVDGQFQKADFDDNKILECHGSISHFQCAEPCNNNIWFAEDENVTVDENTMRADKPFPKCPSCAGIARPNILMFGDWGWLGDRSSFQQHKFREWTYSNKSSNVVIIECGAGTAVPTVRMTSESTASHLSGTLIRINTREPQVPYNHISIPLPALEALLKINSLIKNDE